MKRAPYDSICLPAEFPAPKCARAAGANLATTGAISGFQDMNQWGENADHGGFDSTHSAQWRWNNQSTHLFWKKLTQELELK